MLEILQHLSKHHVEYRLLGTFITPILVILGWIIVNNQNNKREDRKELRKFIDDLIEKTDQLEILSVDFHTSKKYKAALAAEILSNHTKITAQLGRSRLQCFQCFDASIRFHESFSEENFASNNFQKQLHNSDLINNIHTQADLMRDQLEHLFYNTARLTKIQNLAQRFSKYQEAIIIFMAYLGLISFIWIVLSRIPLT
ncbi:hypothetical protein [Stutzerimonas nitrititolerans]|uniref:hypothetical protein n=1 Tax=Stutzerimonas nitrititolerans TaxID=2482751 RepID=UPI0014826DB4|nr:hypothetical protein [Stutzerimonas nitrititolerans]NNT92279.1 hypothetical protein [Stutzerimonas nitrititolerans]